MQSADHRRVFCGDRHCAFGVVGRGLAVLVAIELARAASAPADKTAKPSRQAAIGTRAWLSASR